MDRNIQMSKIDLSNLSRSSFVICSREEFLVNKYDFWVNVQCDWENCIKNKRVAIKKMIRKGIPYFMREKVKKIIRFH